LCDNDALAFRPEHWQEIAKEETGEKNKGGPGYKKGAVASAEVKLGFMPFAAHLCPAGGEQAQGFGFKTIGLLVGTLCTEIGEDWAVKGDQESLLDLSEPLDSDRQAYGN
jgi:hypothetical protein